MTKPRIGTGCARCESLEEAIRLLGRRWNLDDDARALVERHAARAGIEPGAFASQLLRSRLQAADAGEPVTL